MTDWPEIARCFSVLRPAQWVEPSVLAFLESLKPDQPVIVACSGGADSVFLLLTVHSMLGPDRLRICHFNHGLRGEESDGDEQFVATLAESLNLQFKSGKLSSADEQTEATLRKARYEWLIHFYKQVDASAILLGHHADDVLETQLMGLFTGSGPSGLSSPMPVRRFPDGHIRLRPLLGMKRSTIEKTLVSLQVPWREDSSNTDTGYTRNWIRKEMIPLVAERFPQDIHAGSQRTRKLMEDSLDALDALVGELDLDISDPSGFGTKSLKLMSRGIIRRVLYAWWMQHFGEAILPASAGDRIVELIRIGKDSQPVSIGAVPILGEAVQAASITRDGKLVLKPEKSGRAPVWQCGCHWTWQAGPLYLPTGCMLSGEKVSWETGESTYKEADPGTTAWLSDAEGPFYVRQWQAGDRYQPLGAPGTRKLQDIFGDAKLHSEQKQALPVILNSKGEILWVPGFPPANDAKVCNGINSALRLTYRTQ